MVRRTTLTVVGAIAFAASAVIAQSGIPEGAIGQQPVPPAVGTSPKPPSAPTLTDAQKQQLQSAAAIVENWQLKFENAQLRAQQAAAEHEKARAALQQVIAAVTPAGYQLNEKLELVKIPEPKKEPPK